ncbi:unannotated protein [freshwater metagenome]|uniref:Unannotated protein n=1 Tax=freshwater metagenome TaxID=449393 RepID=A0A6J7JBD7_9ZZZZ|nr:hypothetical protein [Actinomycetota bacterium]
MRPLRAPDVVLLVSAIALLVVLSLDWFAGPPGASTTGWSSLGWLAVALVAGCALLGLVLVAMLATGVCDRVNLHVAVALAALAPLAFIVLVLVVLLQPGLGLGLSNAAVEIRWPACAGIVAFAALTVAAWWSLHADGPVPLDRGGVEPELRPAP